MSRTVFFSWQADTPTKTGRNLIERSLERASSAIGQDSEIEEAVRSLEVDKDTKGVSGSPPIVDTILRKIDAAAVFVPDLTFVGQRRDGRPTPNPNVLIEYGWALKSLTHSRIIPIMNTAYGEPTSESMPFDMKHLRFPITYYCPEDASDGDRQLQRASLAKTLEIAIRAVLDSPEFRAALPPPPAIPPFLEKQPLTGLGNFREVGAPLGRRPALPFSDAVGPEIYQENAPAYWLRVLPLNDQARTWTESELRKAVWGQGSVNMLPMFDGAGSYGEFRAADGIGMYASMEGNKTCWSVTLFKTGELWSVNTYLLQAVKQFNGRSSIPLDEGSLARKLAEYAKVLEFLGIQPPYRWIAGMEDLEGRALWVPQAGGRTAHFPSGSSVEKVVTVEGIYSPGEPPNVALLPFFNAIYEACGIVRPAWLDAQ